MFDLDMDGVFDEFCEQMQPTPKTKVQITIGTEPDTMTVEGTVVEPGDPIKFSS